MLAVFRINGRLLEKGDQLVEPLRLTSSRWQVLGAVALAGKPLTAPQIADAMGITRQGSQKQLNRMVEEGFLGRMPNPSHERSPLYELTQRGREAFDAAMTRHTAWANRLAEGLTGADLDKTLQTLEFFYRQLDMPLPANEVRS
jgi:DNA-binding MarR family transcriptional regulator